MLERKVYRKPPLLEMFADFSFNEDLPWDTPRLIDFHRAVGGSEVFPNTKDPEARPRDKRPGAAGRHRAGRRLWQFLSLQGDRVVQVGPHRLVMNQLPPYYGWEKFRQDAERILGAYLAVWPADRVESASLHYIDMVVLPGETVNLVDYFNLYPVFPAPLLERAPSNLAMACQFAGAAEGETLVVSFRHDVKQEGQLVFHLQWDYFATRTYQASVADMINWLNSAHEQTSEAFRASLTPKCEALFEPE
jgi:uncharacterized protein (TIGR04255 family)